jgi:RHS repeat-associated protein
VGNRKTMVTAAGTTQYAYDAADRLTSVTPPGQGAVSYGWDDNSNLTARGSGDFDWDAEDRLTSATVSSVTTTFTYNGDGLRDSLTTGGNTTTFTWDVNRSIPQVLDDEDFRYVYGIGRIAQVGASTHYYLSDGLGSTMALTHEDGDVVNDYDYDVFGALRDSSGSQDNDFTFAGEQVDGSTGLQYLRARYYDMATGRLVSKDTWGGCSLRPGSQHPFTYAINNPIEFKDPSGLAAEAIPQAFLEPAAESGYVYTKQPCVCDDSGRCEGNDCALDSNMIMVCDKTCKTEYQTDRGKDYSICVAGCSFGGINPGFNPGDCVVKCNVLATKSTEKCTFDCHWQDVRRPNR